MQSHLNWNDNILCRACVPVTGSIHFKVFFDKKYMILPYANELYLFVL